LQLQQGSGGLLFSCFRYKTGPIYCPDSMAPKRPFDKVAEESQEPPQVKRRRIRRSGAHLHQDVGEESPVLSKNKISFRGPGGRSSIGICIFHDHTTLHKNSFNNTSFNHTNLCLFFLRKFHNPCCLIRFFILL
jgi:hypothetical protein